MSATRSSYPSAAQIECLIEFLDANRTLAKGYSKTARGRATATSLWNRITVKLNSMGGGAIKSSKRWMKYWSDKKSAIKKKAAARAAARRKTGGGVEEVPDLSEVEERILHIMGGEGFAEGDSHLRIPLFDQPTQDSPTREEPVLLTQDSPAEEPIVLGLTPQNAASQEIDTEDVDVFLEHRRQSQGTDTQMDGIDPSPGTPNGGIQLPASAESIIISQPPPPLVRQARSPARLRLPVPAAAPPGDANRRFRLQSAAATTRHRPRRPLQASPPSQRRSYFASLASRFLRLEEQRLDLDRRIVDSLEDSADRERLTAQANCVLGEGLKALAETINNNRVG